MTASRVPRAARCGRSQGALCHPLPESRPGQPGQQVRGPSAHLGVALVERGLEQRFIGQAQAAAMTDRNMTRSGPAASQLG